VTGHIPNRLLNLSFGFLNRPQPAVLQKTEVILSPNLDILPQTQAPRVITFHDLSFIHYPEFFSPKDHAWHRLQHYAKQAQAATRIIAVSEFTKQDLINILKLPAEKIDVVYSGINCSFRQISPQSPELTNYQQAHQLTRPFILYLGSLEPRKNLPLLIKAFTELKKQRQFNDYELVFAGRPGYRANEIMSLAHQSPVSKDIRFLGSVADEDRVFLYNLARVFVFPSWFEGFGFPPLEAQACGTPVIASNRSSLPEILGESALLVDPWKVHELAKAISSIESDSKMRDTIIAAGLQNANRFSWQ
jgi:glycosyltransferase involved in cell wall biosynthesis